MVIAELLVSLGVVGNGSAEKALKGVQKGLGDISSSGLAAKAAVLGVLYGLEKMMASSAARGLELQQFANFTGLSTEKLQKWEFAARQSGVAAEDIEGSIKGLQQSIAEMQLGGGPPGGIGIIAQYTGGFDKAKMNDAFYMMEKLKQFAQNKTLDTPFANHFLKSMGLSDNTIAFLRTTKVNLDSIKPSQIFSNSEIAQLSKIEVAWFNFWNKIKLIGGHLTASFGLDAIKELENAFNFLTDTTQNIIDLTKQFPILKDIAIAAGVAIAAAFAPITTIVSGIILLLSEIQKFRQGKDSIIGDVVNAAKNLPSVDEVGSSIMSAPGKLFDYLSGSFAGTEKQQEGTAKAEAAGSDKAQSAPLVLGGNKDQKAQAVAPVFSILKGALPAENSAIPPLSAKDAQTSKVTTNNISQTINHVGDAKDTQEVANTHKAAARNAYWQMQAIKQVN